MSQDIWILVHHRQGRIEEVTFGLIGEGRRLLSESRSEGTITAVALLGLGSDTDLEVLGAYGADKVLCVESESLTRYQGEIVSLVLSRLAKKHRPSFILMAQVSETDDLAPMLAALLETGLATRAMDLRINENGIPIAIRPVANGYLFEEIHFDCAPPPIVSFLPSVLSSPAPDREAKVEILTEPMDESLGGLRTKVVEVIEAVPEELSLEADIIVAGGRGVGKGEAFNIIPDLARAIGGSVGGTRPIIDWQTLPFERQIGQTGKTVAPRLIFTCGISGANEFTAGMERSQLIIAIDTDPRARIFRFADLTVIGDVHEVVPRLIDCLKKTKESN